MIAALLHPVLASAEALVPGMVGRLADPSADDLRPQGGNGAAVRRLVDAIAAEAPAAGKAYWAVRAWGMMTWQPGVLAVLAVHRCGVVPRLDALGQAVRGSAVYGYTLPPDEVLHGMPEPALIDRAGAQVRRLADRLLADLDAVIRMKPVLAQRLLADRVLGTLARPGLPQAADLAATAERWLAAMDLTGASALAPLEVRPGVRRLVLDRKACCLTYLVGDGTLCASCPKLAPQERHDRQRADWETARV